MSQQLLNSLALISLFMMIWIYAEPWFPRKRKTLKAIFFGLVVGTGTVLSMSNPVVLAPGLIVDLRASLVAIATFLGGPIAGAVAVVIGVSFRLYLGGVGAIAGMVSILLAYGAGLVVARMQRGRGAHLGDIVLLAAAVSATGPLAMLALPSGAFALAVQQALLPSAIFNFMTVSITGIGFLYEWRRRENAAYNEIYRGVIDALPDCLNAKDNDGKFIVANPATALLMRSESATELLGKSDYDFYPHAVADKFRKVEIECMQNGLPVVVKQSFEFSDGTNGILSTLKVPLRDKRGDVVGLITHNRDVTEHEQLRSQLRQAELMLQQAITNMSEGLVVFDASGDIVFCNEQYGKLFSRTSDLRRPGHNIADILWASAERGEELEPMKIALLGDREKLIKQMRNRGIRAFPLTDGKWIEVRSTPLHDGGWVTMVSDVTVRKNAEIALENANRKLEQLALTDGLTGLYSRRFFDVELSRELARAAREAQPLSLILLDVDHFKSYNDTYGHQSGDDALRGVSAALKASLRRPGDVLARYGGEEIAAILPNTGPEGAAVIGESFRIAVERLALPHTGSKYRVVTASIGVATTSNPSGTITPQTLIANSDNALYEAKSSGRNRVCTYYPRQGSTGLPKPEDAGAELRKSS